MTKHCSLTDICSKASQKYVAGWCFCVIFIWLLYWMYFHFYDSILSFVRFSDTILGSVIALNVNAPWPVLANLGLQPLFNWLSFKIIKPRSFLLRFRLVLRWLAFSKLQGERGRMFPIALAPLFLDLPLWGGDSAQMGHTRKCSCLLFAKPFSVVGLTAANRKKDTLLNLLPHKSAVLHCFN